MMTKRKKRNRHSINVRGLSYILYLSDYLNNYTLRIA
jgi:hypothetical protein